MDAGKELEKQLKIFTVYHKQSFIPPAPYLHPVHAGRAIAPVSLLMDGDDSGENISSLNPRMCELTVIYNAWKNKKYSPSVYWGLCHYRRYFTVNLHWTRIKKKVLFPLEENNQNLDKVFSTRLSRFLLRQLNPRKVILPVPMIIHHEDGRPWNIKEHYCRDHDADGWKIMKEALNKLYPGYIKSFEAVGDREIFYQYNMMIAHHTVWDKYLAWLFDIVFYINGNYRFPDDPYQSRAIGFMAERLLNVYFYHHRNEYTIIEMPVAAFTK